MPYGLVMDGQLRDLGDLQYLLSPQACHRGAASVTDTSSRAVCYSPMGPGYRQAAHACTLPLSPSHDLAIGGPASSLVILLLLKCFQLSSSSWALQAKTAASVFTSTLCVDTWRRT